MLLRSSDVGGIVTNTYYQKITRHIPIVVKLPTKTLIVRDPQDKYRNHRGLGTMCCRLFEFFILSFFPHRVCQDPDTYAEIE